MVRRVRRVRDAGAAVSGARDTGVGAGAAVLRRVCVCTGVSWVGGVGAETGCCRGFGEEGVSVPALVVRACDGALGILRRVRGAGVRAGVSWGVAVGRAVILRRGRRAGVSRLNRVDGVAGGVVSGVGGRPGAGGAEVGRARRTVDCCVEGGVPDADAPVCCRVFPGIGLCIASTKKTCGYSAVKK